MRVIDHKRKPVKEKRKRSHKPVLLLFVSAVIGVGAYTVMKPEKTAAPEQKTTASVTQGIVDTPKKGTLKNFTGEEFKNLYNNFAYPNTARINENSPITGDNEADAKIRKLAIARGYQVRSAPVTEAFNDVGQGMMLQQRAAQPWLDLVDAAKKDGLEFGLTAAYRSADDQRNIFVGRLAQLNIPIGAIGDGTYDAQVNQVLRSTAIPGFSRHHTGYTVDIACGNTPDTAFAFTECFKWLSANNYEKAKTHGWIPSYPEGSGLQGPDPEAWEYVWVGKDAVTE